MYNYACINSFDPPPSTLTFTSSVTTASSTSSGTIHHTALPHTPIPHTSIPHTPSPTTDTGTPCATPSLPTSAATHCRRTQIWPLRRVGLVQNRCFATCSTGCACCGHSEGVIGCFESRFCTGSRQGGFIEEPLVI